MGRRTSILAVEQIKEINMTPLIDLTFILLITFIITFPLIEQGIQINLPRGNATELDEQRMRTISIDVDSNIFLDREPITKEALTSEMKTMGIADPDITIMVRADQTIQYARLVEVLQILHDAKIARLALVTAPEK